MQWEGLDTLKFGLGGKQAQISISSRLDKFFYFVISHPVCPSGPSASLFHEPCHMQCHFLLRLADHPSSVTVTVTHIITEDCFKLCQPVLSSQPVNLLAGWLAGWT